MNTLKRTLALVATLAMATTAFASCGETKEEETKTEATTAATEEATEEEATEDETEAETEPEESTGEIDASVGVGGDTFTVAAWNADDVPYLIAQWKGIDFETIADDLANGNVEGIDFINFGVGGGDASEKYDQLFKSGSDLDVYFCEADWALKYIGDDDKTLALSKLGLGDADFSNIFSYTDEIGKTTDGVRKGISWQAAAGGFGYNASLAKEYLGVESPAEMQEKIGDWDKFVAAAKEVNEASSGKTALADTLGGMWQAYACGRTTPWVVNNNLEIDDFCKEFGFAAEIVSTDIDDVFSGVSVGKYDIGVGLLSYTDERNEKFLFSTPDYEGGAVAVVLTTVAQESNGFFGSIVNGFDKTFVREGRWQMFLDGIGVTLLISCVSAVLGTIIGFALYTLGVYLRNKNKAFLKFLDLYVLFVKRMPIVVFLMITYYAVFGNSKES